MPRLISVGRLDINTEGLLLLTNDGELARYLEHPTQGFSRTYRIRAHGNVDETAIARLAKGVTIDGVHYRPAETTLDSRQGSNCWMTMRFAKARTVKSKSCSSNWDCRSRALSAPAMARSNSEGWRKAPSKKCHSALFRNCYPAISRDELKEGVM